MRQTRTGTGREARRSLPWAAVVGVLLVAFATACTPPSTSPDGSVPQVRPFGTNGMVVEGSQVWVADLIAGQVLRFDPATGAVTERYGQAEGLCHTDDLVVAPDGTLVATCPGEGKVIAIERGGRAHVLADVGRGVNPIALDPSGTAVLVGFGSEEDDRLLRVPLDGGPVQVVADGLPVLNGFSIGPDGRLYVPTGGAAGLLGGGGLGRIDLATGAFEQLDLHFPEAAVTGFAFACGVDVDAAGTVYVAQCASPAVYAVEPATGAVTRVGAAVTDVADNVAVLADGRVLMSGFFGARLTLFAPQGDGAYSGSALDVGA